MVVRFLPQVRDDRFRGKEKGRKMLLSPPLTMFQANCNSDWWLDDLIAAQEPTADLNRPMERLSSIPTSQRHFLQFLSPDQQQLKTSPITKPLSSAPSDSSTVVKKLNHNASERDRRKKLNGLYSSLRSLLPGADRMVQLELFSF